MENPFPVNQSCTLLDLDGTFDFGNGGLQQWKTPFRRWKLCGAVDPVTLCFFRYPKMHDSVDGPEAQWLAALWPLSQNAP
jgi:hypothetical protein